MTSSVQRFYRYHAMIYDSTRWMILHGRRAAVARMGLTRDARVLEVGCGTGLNFRHVLRHLGSGPGRLTGLDFSADMLRKAEHRLQHRGWENVDLVQGDATQLDLPERYDGILFAYSLTMIPDWRRALECAAAHLAPHGRLVVLDFGPFDRWGPLGPAMRTWLRLNHVDTRQPYVDFMRGLFDDLETHYWLGGYNFTAVGRRTQ